jgi:hypothetical protein
MHQKTRTGVTEAFKATCVCVVKFKISFNQLPSPIPHCNALCFPASAHFNRCKDAIECRNTPGAHFDHARFESLVKRLTRASLECPS